MNGLKCDELIGIIKIIFLRIYKSFIRPPLDYADIIYDEPNNLTMYNLKTKYKMFNIELVLQ